MLLLLFPLAMAQEAPPAEPEADARSEDDEVAPPEGSLLLQNARLIDGTGAPPRPADLLIIDGRIADIGEGLEPERAAERVDLGGAAVTPGLIDSHVHITFAPGQGLEDWSRATLDDHLQHHLRAYVAAGVTTVLDCAGMWEEVDRVRGWLDDGLPGPRVLSLGEPPTIAEGYGPAVLPELPVQNTPEDIAAFMASQKAHGAAGVKLLWEEGIVTSIWAMPEASWWEAVAESAAAEDLPMFAHAMGPEETIGALALEPRALLHGLMKGDEEAEAALAASGVPVVATVNISASSLWYWNPERFDEPLLNLLAHPDELTAVQDPEARDRSSVAVGQVATPGVPKWLARRLGRKSNYVEKILAERLEVTGRMVEAGVPLVVGSDAPGWPLMLDNLPAYSTIRELELLTEVGLTPAEVLTAATSRPAGLLEIGEEVGTLQVGYAADLVVHTRDPLADIGAWRELEYVMRAGELRTPQAWMTE